VLIVGAEIEPDDLIRCARLFQRDVRGKRTGTGGVEQL
jgi:hypothetical protein